MNKSKKKKALIALITTAILLAGIAVFFAVSSQDKVLESALRISEDIPEQVVTQDTIVTEETEAPTEDEDVPGEEAVAEATDEEQTASHNITVTLEGTVEEIPAELFVGDGYSICVPTEDWKMYAPDAWNSAFNEEVQF